MRASGTKGVIGSLPVVSPIEQNSGLERRSCGGLTRKYGLPATYLFAILARFGRYKFRRKQGYRCDYRCPIKLVWWSH